MSNETSISPNPAKRYTVEKEEKGRIKWGNSQQEGRSRKFGKEEREKESKYSWSLDDENYVLERGKWKAKIVER